MTLYRAQVIDTPVDPFSGGALRCDADAGLLVEDGVIVDRGGFAHLRRRHPEADVVELPDGILLPGLVDTHVHFPQVRVIGALGMPRRVAGALRPPEESRLAEAGYARAVAAEFVAALLGAGTTTALVFGSHFAPAVDALFEAAAASGLRITSGLVVGDRMLRPDLHTSAKRAYDEGRALAARWHGVGRSRYAVIPRFALSCMTTCSPRGQLHRDVPDSWFTSHLNENLDEVAAVRRLFDGGSYLDCYDATACGSAQRPGTRRSPDDEELKRLPRPARAWRTAPPATRRWAAACSAQPHLPTACPSRSGARRGRHRLLSFKEGCRRTSCSAYAVRTAQLSAPPTAASGHRSGAHRWGYATN